MKTTHLPSHINWPTMAVRDPWKAAQISLYQRECVTSLFGGWTPPLLSTGQLCYTTVCQQEGCNYVQSRGRSNQCRNFQLVMTITIFRDICKNCNVIWKYLWFLLVTKSQMLLWFAVSLFLFFLLQVHRPLEFWPQHSRFRLSRLQEDMSQG